MQIHKGMVSDHHRGHVGDVYKRQVYLAAVMAMYAGGKKDEIAAMAGYGDSARDALKKMDDLAKSIITEHELSLIHI